MKYKYKDNKPYWTDKKLSPEHIEKISLSQKGRQFTAEHKRKISEAKKGKPQKGTGHLGCKHTNEWKKLASERQKGNKHHNWKGGRRLDKYGYILLYMPDNPNAQGKYVFEHRYVMQQYLGRPLASWELVHHKNGKKNDNRLKNLIIISNKNHHGEIECPHCQQIFLIK